MKTLLLAILLQLALPLTGQAEVKIIELKHRSSAELEKRVRPLLEDGEKVTAAGSHLVLIASGDSLKAAEELIALLDTRQRNLMVAIRQQESAQTVGSDSSASVHYGNNDTLAGSVAAGFRRGNTDSSEEQQLTLVEGGCGLIQIGREIPYTEKWAVLTGDNTGYSQETAYKSIATGFWVCPEQIVGDSVLLDVEPYVSKAEQEGTQAPQIDFSQLRTRLQVPLGNWYPLGSQLAHRDKVSKEIISWRSSDRQTDRRLEIRIDAVE